MQPLFEQVYHGCAAGLYDEVFFDVYWEKINRWRECTITHKLGAWETDLSLAKTFFAKGDLSQLPLVSKKRAHAFLLNEAGLALKNIGKPKEAEEPILTGLKMAIEANSKGDLAWILHLLGKAEEAGNWFRHADELHIKIDGNPLHGLTGVFYADFLILIKRIDEAFELTKQNLEICRDILKSPADISRCHRSLGAIERISGNHKEAKVHLQNALELARKVGQPALEIEALIEFGRLHLNMGKHEDAVRDAKEVLKICARTGFKFYEPGAEIMLSKACRVNDLEQAKTFAHAAYEKAIAMKYRWQEGDAAHLLGEIYLTEGDKARDREWIERAVACRKEILDPNVEQSETILNGL